MGKKSNIILIILVALMLIALFIFRADDRFNIQF